MGVATGCGCKEVYRFPHTTYPYSSCIYLFFLQQHPYFLFIFLLNVFRSCSSTFLAHGNHMKAAHTVLYMKKHTQTYASYPAMDIMSVV